jgi:hypothetical protein
MESVPHRDFLYTATSNENLKNPQKPTSSLDGYFCPFSTPISKELSAHLKKSRMDEVGANFSRLMLKPGIIQNIRLHRADSITINTGLEVGQKFSLNAQPSGYCLSSPPLMGGLY